MRTNVRSATRAASSDDCGRKTVGLERSSLGSGPTLSCPSRKDEDSSVKFFREYFSEKIHVKIE
jgi:hypothetical protein